MEKIIRDILLLVVSKTASIFSAAASRFFGVIDLLYLLNRFLVLLSQLLQCQPQTPLMLHLAVGSFDEVRYR